MPTRVGFSVVPTKVTPSSKVVGDLALHLVAMDVDPADFEANPGAYDVPNSVVGFMAGELGDLPGGLAGAVSHQAVEGEIS